MHWVDGQGWRLRGDWLNIGEGVSVLLTADAIVLRVGTEERALSLDRAAWLHGALRYLLKEATGTVGEGSYLSPKKPAWADGPATNGNGAGRYGHAGTLV